MTEHHPINPPTELVQELRCRLLEAPDSGAGAIIVWSKALARVAQWGADQELEACCGWLEQNVGRWEIPLELRDARRPKPQSLKKQALNVYNRIYDCNQHADFETIRRALEALPND
jgi:hypothetical protein